MNKNFLLSFLTVLLLFLGTAFSKAQYSPVPMSNWYTIETANFYIHYPQNYNEIAQDYADLMERIHQDLTPVMKYRPAIKTNIVIIDNRDILFGGATHVFQNTIYISPIQLPIGIGHYDDFRYNVLLHEYVHILDLDMLEGLWDYLRMAIGRFFTPNMLCPNWMVEGYATFMETEMTAGGRGRDPLSDMYLRMAFLEDKVDGIDRFDPDFDEWPINEVPYVFGESLYRHMKGNDKGPQKVVNFRTDNSRKFNPFDFSSLNFYWNGDFKYFYETWKQNKLANYKEQEIKIRREGLTGYTRLTNLGYQTWGLEWSPNDDGIYFINNTFDAHQSLMLYNLSNNQTEKLRNVNSLYTGIDFDKSSNSIVFNQFEIFNKTSVLTYESRYSIVENKMTKKAMPERILNTCVDTKGNRCFVRLENEKTVLYGKVNGQEKILIPPNDTVFISNPVFSPNNRYIAYDKWVKGGKKDIYIYDFETEREKALTDDTAWDITPSWTNDGQYVLFSSDRSSVYNIYAINIETGEVKKITNMLGGAFYPKMSNTGDKLAFLSYSSSGYDLSIMDSPDDIASLPVHSNSPKAGFYNVMEKPFDHEMKYKKAPQLNNSRYNALRSLAQPIRYPYFSIYDTNLVIGAGLTGKDILSRHIYSALITYDISIEHISYQIDYQNSYFPIDIILHAEDVVDPVYTDYIDPDIDSLRRIMIKNMGFALNYTIPKIDRYFAAQVGYNWIRQSSYFQDEELPNDYYNGAYSEVSTLLEYSDAKAYKRSISNEEGLYAGISTGHYLRQTGNMSNFNMVEFLLKKYQRVPGTKHHVLFGQFNAALADIKSGQNTLVLNDSIRSYGMLEWNQRKLGGVLEYRLPLISIERGYKLWPMYFKKVFASLYGEYWNFQNDDNIREIGIYGAELHASFKAFYLFPVLFSVGYSDNWMGNPSKRDLPVYFNLALSFTLE